MHRKSSSTQSIQALSFTFVLFRFVRQELGNEVKLVIYGHSMGTGVGSRAVAEVTNDKSIRVDGVILDSPMHSVMYAVKQTPNFLYYSSFIFDWQKFLEVAGMEFNVAKVSYSTYLIFTWHNIMYLRRTLS